MSDRSTWNALREKQKSQAEPEKTEEAKTESTPVTVPENDAGDHGVTLPSEQSGRDDPDKNRGRKKIG